MKRGSQVTVKIEKTEFPSVGISEFEGKKLYIKGRNYNKTSYRSWSFHKRR